MTNATVLCDQCDRQTPLEEAEYSLSGKRMCPECLGTSQIAEIEARNALSRRKMRIALGTALGLVTVASIVLSAMGLGRFVVGGLFLLGGVGCTAGFFGACFTGYQWFKYWSLNSPTHAKGARFFFRTSIIVFVASVALLIAAGILTPFVVPYTTD